MSDTEEPSRWTCEACGCHTNVEPDRSCGICGTSRSGGGILRRRAPWLPHHRAIIGIPPDADDDDVEDFIYHLQHPPQQGDFWDWDDAESAIESLAMEVASSRGRMIESRERFLEAARHFGQRRQQRQVSGLGSGRTRSETAAAAASQQTIRVPRLSAPEMLAQACPEYQPRWLRSTQAHATRGGGGTLPMTHIEVGQGECQNIAHVPFGAGEGSTIRAETPFPRNEIIVGMDAGSEAPTPGSKQMKRNIFGFRVAFDRVHGADGESMGGGYLVGVTSSSFTSYTDRHGLQHSPYFWGIDDSGKKYEGSRRGQWTLGERTRRPGASANFIQQSNSLYASQLNPEDVSMNGFGVLFGNRQVLTIVCDLDTRVMSFWRDSVLLGTLITSLPVFGELFPVAVPYHHGSSVAITGVHGDPLALLASFIADKKQKRREKDEEHHRQLLVDRGILIQQGKITKDLRSTLIDIFKHYSTSPDTSDNMKPALNYTEAARLYYRCGIRLSLINVTQLTTIDEFLAIFEKICSEDENKVVKILPPHIDIKVGDSVELVEGYDKFGDAAGGPLQPFERGVVVDLQDSTNGERKSVRVLHNQRRWWYQPSAILPESSGLIETPAVFFIKKVLRAHGFEHTTLTQLSSKTLRSNACQVGDIVKPRKGNSRGMAPIFGRVVVDDVSASDPLVRRSRAENGTVLIEFADRRFLEATNQNGSQSMSGLERRRIRQSKLAFCSMTEIVRGCTDMELKTHQDQETSQNSNKVCHRLQSEVTAVSHLDQQAILTIANECRKSETLASLFSAGLPEAIASAIDMAERQMNSLEPREDLPEKISILGRLVLVISKRLFSDSIQQEHNDFDTDALTDGTGTEEALSPRLLHDQSVHSSRREAADGREGAREVVDFGSALRQRRSILLSLMDRSRRNNQNFLFDHVDREPLFGGETFAHPVVPSIPFGAGSRDPLEAGDVFARISILNSPNNQSAEDRSSDPTSIDSQSLSCYLDSIMRCRITVRPKTDGAVHLNCVRRLCETGILPNDLVWIKALLETQRKKTQLSSSPNACSSLRDSVDEEGFSLLLLAVSLGCSSGILNYLISQGLTVTPLVIKMAALTNQKNSLQLLLQNAPYSDDFLSEEYTAEVMDVFQAARSRQQALQCKMREEGGSFIVSLTQRLIQFGLNCHRHMSSRVDRCSAALAEILVGDVLLRSLRDAQQINRSSRRLSDDELERLEADDSFVGEDLPVGGIFCIIPRDVLGSTVLSERSHLTRFLSLVEDYLFSKNLADVASGLSLLLILLKHYPIVAGSSELKRFGIQESVNRHFHCITDRADLMANQSLDSNRAPSESSAPTCSVISCPKRHTAVIHITRHNSFRCDICGKGVDRGRPMYGCRECDWDACEYCTDKSVSGSVKRATIKKLALECLNRIEEVPMQGVEELPYSDILKAMEGSDNTASLQALLKKLMDRDGSAMQLLGRMLLTVGVVTMHQFRSMVLPALYLCLTGHAADEARRGRRKKRARVIDDLISPSESAFDDKLLHVKHMIHILFRGGTKGRTNTVNQSDTLVACVPESELETKFHAESDRETNCSDEARELLRRCHQLLSFHEKVPRTEDWLGVHFEKLGELHSLTKPLTMKLIPSTRHSLMDDQVELLVRAQPLVPMSDLNALVLRRSTIGEKYDSYASQLAEDMAVIVERPLRARTWRIGVVIAFNKRDGTHAIHFAKSISGFVGASISISVSFPLDVNDLIFEEAEENVQSVHLAERSYRVLSRPGRIQNLQKLRRLNIPESSKSNDAKSSCSSLSRAWSALSLADAMQPVDLKIANKVSPEVSEDDLVFMVQTGDKVFKLICEKGMLESQPAVAVSFSAAPKLPGLTFRGSDDMPLLSALNKVFGQKHKYVPEMSDTCELFFSITVEEGGWQQGLNKTDLAATSHSCLPRSSGLHQDALGCRSRKVGALSARSSSLLDDEDEDGGAVVFDGLDVTCMQCLKIIDLLRMFTFDASTMARDEAFESLFVNMALTRKLNDQLSLVVPVVAGALPDWCVHAPTIAPSVFSYESRRELVERLAFGISRSALKQQEAKVNVSRLRQRMATLRNRAVELVGEAFSGGAEDPTALQLQADELYGMEEALASRVRAAFKAAKWQEHSLQVAKASIRREHLLDDADAIMQLYANDDSIFHRRLEIRFEGESGFDLASGTEAGVTRGFYADVAESLLSTENVEGVLHTKYCPDSIYMDSFEKMGCNDMELISSKNLRNRKVPLWIPDLDTSGSVVIPTPRADSKGGVGVFPRPLPTYHPLMREVLQRFRFIGRLFASAARDGFMFPLPISPSFLKLVIYGNFSPESSETYPAGMTLTSQDLPRPGFLGGEVYAAETYICRALDLVDGASSALSQFELDKRYKEIATDVEFARVALGKHYDCSFEDYFQDRTFVDPLDSAQDESAAQLCAKGFEKQVTIFNIREWVALAKRFMLCDGIKQQACAFRDGVEDFFCINYLKVFSPDELHRDICGGGDGVEHWTESAIMKLFKLDGGRDATDAFVTVAAIGDEIGSTMSRRFGPTSPTITYLIRALLEATIQQRRQFLSFVTSVPIETPGRIEVVPIVAPNGECLPMSDPSCLPRANTCARRLYLPKFASYDEGSDSFKEVFWAVVREESRFKGFFEWRG